MKILWKWIDFLTLNITPFMFKWTLLAHSPSMSSLQIWNSLLLGPGHLIVCSRRHSICNLYWDNFFVDKYYLDYLVALSQQFSKPCLPWFWFPLFHIGPEFPKYWHISSLRPTDYDKLPLNSSLWWYIDVYIFVFIFNHCIKYNSHTLTFTHLKYTELCSDQYV